MARHGSRGGGKSWAAPGGQRRKGRASSRQRWFFSTRVRLNTCYPTLLSLRGTSNLIEYIFLSWRKWGNAFIRTFTFRTHTYKRGRCCRLPSRSHLPRHTLDACISRGCSALVQRAAAAEYTPAVHFLEQGNLLVTSPGLWGPYIYKEMVLWTGVAINHAKRKTGASMSFADQTFLKEVFLYFSLTILLS